MSGIRARLAGDLESQYDKVVAALEEAMESTKKAWAFCPKCRAKVQVDHPDHGARIKAVELWLEQGFGRPGAGAARVDPVTAGVEMTLADLEAMSSNALAAFAWESEESWTRYRRHIEKLEAIEWPPGFAEALRKLEGLAREFDAEKADA